MFYSVIGIRDFSLFNQSAQALLKGYFIQIYINLFILIDTYKFIYTYIIFFVVFPQTKLLHVLSPCKHTKNLHINLFYNIT